MLKMNGKRVLIFGGTGSLGRALIGRLLDTNQILVFSRDESKHWTIRNEIKNKDLQFAVGDVRDASRVEETILRFRPNFIIIAAALKHVDTCELSPYESIQTNVLGVKNIVDAVEKNLHHIKDTLETVLMVSTDKACAPVNVYGMCKAVSERLVTSRGIDHVTPKFVAVRYGNVLESRGSIIPLFKHQGDTAPAFTLTHKDMTRFLMTLDDSIDLIIKTANEAKSGETWLPKLKAMRILDLAQLFGDLYDKPVKTIGMRPGEKIHEALISDAESVRVRDIGSHYVMAPAYSEPSLDAKIFNYTSNDDVMTKGQLKEYLDSISIFSRSLKDFSGKHIEEIRPN